MFFFKMGSPWMHWYWWSIMFPIINRQFGVFLIFRHTQYWALLIHGLLPNHRNFDYWKLLQPMFFFAFLLIFRHRNTSWRHQQLDLIRMALILVPMCRPRCLPTGWQLFCGSWAFSEAQRNLHTWPFWVEQASSGFFFDCRLWKITILNGKTHYFYGHYQQLHVSLPEGNRIHGMYSLVIMMDNPQFYGCVWK